MFLTGAQTRFTFELPNHRLRFTSKVSATDMSTIPPSASLNLPPVTMSGKYIMEEHDSYSDRSLSSYVTLKATKTSPRERGKSAAHTAAT